MKLNGRIVLDLEMSNISFEFAPECECQCKPMFWHTHLVHLHGELQLSLVRFRPALLRAAVQMLEALSTVPLQPGTGTSPLCKGACYVLDYLPEICTNIRWP